MNVIAVPMPPRPFEQIVLTRLFDDLAVSGIPHAVLRNHEDLPVRLGARDLDLLVAPEELKTTLWVITRLARDYGLSIANYYADERMVQVALAGRRERRMFDLKIDLFTSSQVYGIELMPAEEMLRDLRRHNDIPVVSDAVVLLDKWLFHLAVGKPLHAKYDPLFARIAGDHEGRILEKLVPLLGEREAGAQISAMKAGRSSSITLTPWRRLRLLVSTSARRPGRRLPLMGRFLTSRLGDRLRPHGLCLSISGPDGSGKTTVIDLALAQLRQIYGEDSIVYRHFRPAALPRIAEVARATGTGGEVDADYSRPHRAQPSGLFGSLGRLGYYALDYLAGYVIGVRPLIRQRRIVVFDRYYHDMICDPGRSRIGLPDRWLMAVGWMLPLPELSFFIRVAPATAHGRKQELTLAQIAALNSRYEDLVERGWMIEIGNEGPPEQAANAIVDHVVGRFGKRARRAMQEVAS